MKNELLISRSKINEAFFALFCYAFFAFVIFSTPPPATYFDHPLLIFEIFMDALPCSL